MRISGELSIVINSYWETYAWKAKPNNCIEPTERPSVQCMYLRIAHSFTLLCDLINMRHYLLTCCPQQPTHYYRSAINQLCATHSIKLICAYIQWQRGGLHLKINLKSENKTKVERKDSRTGILDSHSSTHASVYKICWSFVHSREFEIRNSTPPQNIGRLCTILQSDRDDDFVDDDDH